MIRYIENQEEHHLQKSFMKEFEAMLREFDVEFNDEYLFVEPE